MMAARADAQVENLPEDVSNETRALVFAKAIARIAILDWEGVGDIDGNPVEPSPEGIGALLDLYPVFERFQLDYIAKGLALEAKAYTVMAIGKLAEIKPLILVDNLGAPAAGKVHVRFVHASPDAPAVDITTADGAKVFPNVAFGKSVDFTPLPAATYNLQARVAGTENVALDLPGVNLPEGAILTVVAQGFAGGAEPKLGVQVISYPAMAAAPAALPVSGGETAANNSWVLMLAGAALLALGFGWRTVRGNAR
jgi:hypothetical protein